MDCKEIMQSETNHYLETKSHEKKIELLRSQAFPYVMETPVIKNEINEVNRSLS
jgi:hypothetical protein